LFGVFLSNRTNRKAIDAADDRAREDRRIAQDRDFRLWQRDTLLRLADEVVEAGIETQDEYAKLAGRGSLLTADEIHAAAKIIDSEGRKIGANIARMRLIGAHEAADRAVVLRNAINDRELLGTVTEVAYAPLNEAKAQLHNKGDEFRVQIANKRKQRDVLLAQIPAARAAFGQTVERELARTTQPDPGPRQPF
jgi:hypothetical protein